MPRNQALTDGERDEIRAMRRENPRMPYREIGALFGVTPSAICNVLMSHDHPAIRGKLHPSHEPKPTMLPRDPVKMALPAPPYETIIRAIPKDRLMAGNGRVARSIPV